MRKERFSVGGEEKSKTENGEIVGKKGRKKEEKRNKKKVKEGRAGGKTSSSLPFFALRFLDREKLERRERDGDCV